jgi:hypothetical protein
MPKRKPAPWTAEELAILEDVYAREGINGAADALPDRSWHAIHQMAHKRGIRCTVVTAAPKAKLQGARLDEAVRLREKENWSFARIGATLGVCEASACNAVMAELCVRKGFRPAERDRHGRLIGDGKERLRLALRKGLKGIDIQLRLGLSASRIALERRRYNAELKARGKALLPPPGAGEAYSGVKLSRSQKAAVEQLLLEGFGAKKVSERTGVSNTSVGRIRNRLIRRLARKGETLPGCDRAGVRHAQRESARHIPAVVIDALEHRLLQGMPVRRAAFEVGLGTCSAYRLRDLLSARLAAEDRALPKPVLPGRSRHASTHPWLPDRKRAAFYVLATEIGFDQAKATICRQLAEQRRAEATRPKTFEEQLARVAAGAALTVKVPLRRPDPTGTLGGVATGALM